MKIEKKCWPDYFQAILEGRKSFELRLADFECKQGDILVLKEFNPKTKQFTGRLLEKEVVSVLKTKEFCPWSKKEVDKYGFQIIQLK